MDSISLKTDLINAILKYLGDRPFVEVAGFIQAIQQQAFEQGAVPAQQPVEETEETPAA
jgi:hypothetical protein